MFSFLKSKEKNNADKEPKQGFVSRLTSGLSKTRQRIGSQIGSLVLGKKEIDQALLDDIESILIRADMGIDTTDFIIETLTKKVARKELNDPADRKSTRLNSSHT